jgi:cholesterol transport system auxiliary component
MAVYDLGLQSHTDNQLQQPHQQRKSVLIADAAAPLWLDNTAIHYRLLYSNPSQSYSYANSRWAAPPAAILTQKIRDRIVTHTDKRVIKNSGTARADYILHIELEEFIQVFDTANDSRIAISLRASLVERNSRYLFAQKDFGIQEKTPTADAAGAVSALGSASNQLVDQLIAWLTAELPHP